MIMMKLEIRRVENTRLTSCYGPDKVPCDC